MNNFDPYGNFYRKARTEIATDGKRVLISYETEVAIVDSDGVVTLLNTDRHSATTRRHIKAFIREHGKGDVDAQYKKLYSGIPIVRY